MGALSDPQTIGWPGTGRQVGGSDTKAAAVATATLAASGTVVPASTYIRGFVLSGLGATAATTIDIVIAGLMGGSITITVAIPAGVTVALTPLVVDFGPAGLQSSATNTAITVTVPSFGAGNTKAIVAAWGYQA